MKITKFLFLIISISAAVSGPLPKEYCRKQYLDNTSVRKFQDYIRIDTSREENLEYAVEFWRRQAAELGLSFSVHRPAGRPICVITWQGEDPALPSIMLNSHMDVVSVEEQEWSYPPFSGEIDENGNMYGRGTQDAKDVAIQYIQAISRLMKDNVSLKRTLHITLMPDEESGGHNGMLVFRDTEAFKALNVGFALDEGISSSDDTFYATYQDKRPWRKLVNLPAAAKKVYLKHDKAKPSSKTKHISNIKIQPQEDIHDYSDMMEESGVQDSDDDCFNTSQTPSNVGNDKDASSSNLQYSVSIRGSLQVILNRYIYNLHSTTHRSGVRRWRCVEYRNHRCMAFLVTKGNVVMNRANLHNHSFHDKKILQKIEKKAVYSALEDVITAKEKEENDKESDTDVGMEQRAFVSIDFADEITDDDVKKRMEL